MPRQVLTIAFVLTAAVLLLPSCSLLPNEPWMGAHKDECLQSELELVDYLSQCPAKYIPQYCRGLAVIAVCRGGEDYE